MQYSMRSLVAVCTLLSIGTINCEDVEAKAKCRAIHHTDVDSADYKEFNCRLDCTIHGKIWQDNLSEGLTCPGQQVVKNVCQSGKCVSTQTLGFIDIEITTAEVPHKVNSYAEVCIKNGTEVQTLPLRDRATCGVCATNVVQNNAHPAWNKICELGSQKKWSDKSMITIMVWDKISAQMTNFLGGITFDIINLLKNNDNHKEMRLKLENGSAKDSFVFARVTWTKA